MAWRNWPVRTLMRRPSEQGQTCQLRRRCHESKARFEKEVPTAQHAALGCS